MGNIDSHRCSLLRCASRAWAIKAFAQAFAWRGDRIHEPSRGVHRFLSPGDPWPGLSSGEGILEISTGEALVVRFDNERPLTVERPGAEPLEASVRQISWDELQRIARRYPTVEEELHAIGMTTKWNQSRAAVLRLTKSQRASLEQLGALHSAIADACHSRKMTCDPTGAHEYFCQAIKDLASVAPGQSAQYAAAICDAVAENYNRQCMQSPSTAPADAPDKCAAARECATAIRSDANKLKGFFWCSNCGLHWPNEHGAADDHPDLCDPCANQKCAESERDAARRDLNMETTAHRKSCEQLVVAERALDAARNELTGMRTEIAEAWTVLEGEKAPSLAQGIDRLKTKLSVRRDKWRGTAEQETRNAFYYRDLLHQIAEKIGSDAYTDEHGGLHEEPLAAKIPAIAVARFFQREAFASALASLADAAELVSEKASIVQPFLSVYRKHGSVIAMARVASKLPRVTPTGRQYTEWGPLGELRFRTSRPDQMESVTRRGIPYGHGQMLWDRDTSELVFSPDGGGPDVIGYGKDFLNCIEDRYRSRLRKCHERIGELQADLDSALQDASQEKNRRADVEDIICVHRGEAASIKPANELWAAYKTRWGLKP